MIDLLVGKCGIDGGSIVARSDGGVDTAVSVLGAFGSAELVEALGIRGVPPAELVPASAAPSGFR